MPKPNKKLNFIRAVARQSRTTPVMLAAGKKVWNLYSARNPLLSSVVAAVLLVLAEVYDFEETVPLGGQVVGHIPFEELEDAILQAAFIVKKDLPKKADEAVRNIIGELGEHSADDMPALYGCLLMVSAVLRSKQRAKVYDVKTAAQITQEFIELQALQHVR